MAANPPIVGLSKNVPSGTSTPNASRMRTTRRTASNEWPPRSKKRSSGPTGRSNDAAQMRDSSLRMYSPRGSSDGGGRFELPVGGGAAEAVATGGLAVAPASSETALLPTGAAARAGRGIRRARRAWCVR